MKKLLLLSALLFAVQSVLFSNPAAVHSTGNTSLAAFQNRAAAGCEKFSRADQEGRHRVWINLTSTRGIFKQILIGYLTGATNGWDLNYDAYTIDGSPYADFYSINEERKLVIQGRALPFDVSDTVPLGYRSAVTEDLTISIDHADGDLSGRNIYLEDKQTGIVHNLKEGGYLFSTLEGVFTDRFVIRYTADKQLGTADLKITNEQLSVLAKDKIIRLKSYQTALKEVCVFDITGKLLYRSTKIGRSELEITSIESGTQMLLVKIVLENGHTLTRKVLF